MPRKAKTPTRVMAGASHDMLLGRSQSPLTLIEHRQQWLCARHVHPSRARLLASQAFGGSNA